MPNKIVTFRRWEVIAAFVALAIAFSVMGVLLNNQNESIKKQNKAIIQQNVIIKHQIKRNSKAITLIQRSRIEACEQNYKDIQGVINLFIEEEKSEQGGKLPRSATLTVLRYYRNHPKDCSFLTSP